MREKPGTCDCSKTKTLQSVKGIENKMNFRPQILPIGVLVPILLSGCIESRMPLFDEAKAVTPAPAGRYEEQEFKRGAWIKKESGLLTIESPSYNWKPDGKEGIEFFTIHDVGDGFYMLSVRQKNPKPNDPYMYALFEVTKDGILAYQPTCSDMMKVRLPKEDLPLVDGSDCFYTDREALVRSFKTYAQRLLPTSRYISMRP